MFFLKRNVEEKHMLNICNVHQLDRIVIATIGLLSILSDGWLSDCLVMLSMIIWLWLPECEAKLISFYNKKTIQAKKMH